MMKNIIKKISAVAMAFTMLATGTAFSSNDELTVHAACNHHCRRYSTTTWSFWGYMLEYYEPKPGPVVGEVNRKTVSIKCANCNKTLSSSYTDYKTWY